MFIFFTLFSFFLFLFDWKIGGEPELYLEDELNDEDLTKTLMGKENIGKLRKDKGKSTTINVASTSITTKIINKLANQSSVDSGDRIIISKTKSATKSIVPIILNKAKTRSTLSSKLNEDVVITRRKVNTSPLAATTAAAVTASAATTTTTTVSSKKEPSKVDEDPIANKNNLDKIPAENIIKIMSDGHALVMLKRTRVKGFCVECIKKNNDPQYKKTMQKIITYCPGCPGGSWICDSCFYEIHN